MESQSNKADVESRLRQTADTMSERMESIQDEVASTGVSIRDWIARNPTKSVGGMLAAGLAVGLFFGKGRSAKRRKHADLVDSYLDALRDQVETAAETEEEFGPALEKALRDRVPLVVYTQEDRGGNGQPEEGRSFLREGAEIFFSTGLSILARQAIESLLANVDLQEVVEEEIRE